jgi:hypothetical protein
MVQCNNESSRMGGDDKSIPTRRRLLVSAGLLAIPIPAFASAEDAISHTAESIHQERVFRASRQRVYDALTARHSRNQTLMAFPFPYDDWLFEN